MQDSTLKKATARTLKWNALDRVATQLLYAAVGIVLANLLSKSDFGLVGIMLAFQAFAIIFVDSGFGAALLQKKEPTQTDYSTVFWFNLILCLAIYLLLWYASPLIATWFGDERLIWLCRVQFLAFVLNGLAIVQTNRLMKLMDVRQIALSDLVGLTLSGALAIWLALEGAGVWALVLQYVSLSAIKTAWLWISSGWKPSMVISRQSLNEIFPVGFSVFSSSFLNTVSLQIYTFVIGLADGLAPLGLYTQADKWSKMGITSITQTLTSSFVPLMAKVQDNTADWRRYTSRVNRFSAMLGFPCMLGLATVATPLFHMLFGQKWDGAIILFQLLALRGIFVIMTSTFNNYFIAGGHRKAIITTEVIKDSLILAAILLTVRSGSVTIIVAGQTIAAVLTWIAVIPVSIRSTHYGLGDTLRDLWPFLWQSLIACSLAWCVGMLALPAWALLALQVATGAIVYLLLLKLTGQPELTEINTLLSKKLPSK